jgi:proteic killer suppression protein
MIGSFKCRETESIYNGKLSKKFPHDIQQRAMRKLIMLNNSKNLNDLKIPPSNCLESLSGDRKEQWSIRVNDKYRICFNWEDGEAFNVEMIDYHK